MTFIRLLMVLRACLRASASTVFVALLSASVAVADDAPQATFDIYEFRVLGNTTLPERAIESAVYPFLGEARSLTTVEQARDALVAAYRDAGLGTVLVDIPEQSVDDGIVRLQVTEGRVESVHIAGARYYSERRLLAKLPSASAGTVPVLPKLQSELTDLGSEARDREITPILKPGSTPGTVEVDFVVKDHLPLHASLEVNNRYTADTSHLRASGSVSYENMFDRADTLSFQYQTSPSDLSQVKVAVLNYAGHTGRHDLTWSAYAIHSDSNVAAVGTLNVIGKGNILGAHLNETLSATSSAVHTLSFGLDFKDFIQNITLPDGTAAKTPIRYLLWTGQYGLATHGERFDSQTQLSVGLGVRGLMNDETQFAFSRSGAHAGFSYLKGAYSATWALPHNWSLSGRAGFQYSDQPLVNNEQYSIGGVDTVRGYLDAASLVDSAVTAGVELHLPGFQIRSSREDAFFFYDRGFGMVQQPLSNQIAAGLVRTDFAGWGAGLRVRIDRAAELFFDVATPLTDAPRGDPKKDPPLTRAGQTRVDFNVRISY